MFIVKPKHEDIMVLDSVLGHRRTFDALVTFLASGETSTEIVTAGRCHLCPDLPFLRSFRIVKSKGLLKIEELPEHTLQVTGRTELLERWILGFKFDPGATGHHHPEQHTGLAEQIDRASIDIIIEVEEWVDDPEAP